MDLLGPGESVPVLLPAPAGETNKERMVRLARCLLAVGVAGLQVEQLLANFDLDLIERQLRWLPARKARKRASIIVASIQNDYEEPANYTE